VKRLCLKNICAIILLQERRKKISSETFLVDVVHYLMRNKAHHASKEESSKEEDGEEGSKEDRKEGCKEEDYEEEGDEAQIVLFDCSLEIHKARVMRVCVYETSEQGTKDFGATDNQQPTTDNIRRTMHD
jgi:hypothetical protein